MSSSGEDSEAAEWEREQMLRGTQSRRNKCQQPSRFEKGVDAIDASFAKKCVMQDIKLIEVNIETDKKKIGSTRLEMAKSEKKIESLEALIETVSGSFSFFKELGTLKESRDIAQFLAQNKVLIEKLPPDQKEMIETLEQRVTLSLNTVEMEQD